MLHIQTSDNQMYSAESQATPFPIVPDCCPLPPWQSKSKSVTSSWIWPLLIASSGPQNYDDLMCSLSFLHLKHCKSILGFVSLCRVSLGVWKGYFMMISSRLKSIWSQYLLDLCLPRSLFSTCQSGLTFATLSAVVKSLPLPTRPNTICPSHFSNHCSLLSPIPHPYPRPFIPPLQADASVGS